VSCSAPRSRRLRSAAHYNPDLDIAPVDDYGSISDEAMPAASGTYVGETTRALIVVVARQSTTVSVEIVSSPQPGERFHDLARTNFQFQRRRHLNRAVTMAILQNFDSALLFGEVSRLRAPTFMHRLSTFTTWTSS